MSVCMHLFCLAVSVAEHLYPFPIDPDIILIKSRIKPILATIPVGKIKIWPRPPRFIQGGYYRGNQTVSFLLSLNSVKIESPSVRHLA